MRRSSSRSITMWRRRSLYLFAVWVLIEFEACEGLDNCLMQVDREPGSFLECSKICNNIRYVRSSDYH